MNVEKLMQILSKYPLDTPVYCVSTQRNERGYDYTTDFEVDCVGPLSGGVAIFILPIN